jgi:hypothetical protein
MPYLWNKPKPQSFFSKSTMGQFKEYPSINPHPAIIEKMMDGGKLVNTNPKKNKNEYDEPETKKKKKKRLPGEKLLKKLTKHKDDNHDEQKLKRIIYAIRSNLKKIEYD